MAEQKVPSGNAIRSRLAELAERSRQPKRPAPEPLVRARPEAPPVPVEAPWVPPRSKADEALQRRGPQKALTTAQISIRLDPDVLEALKAGGRDRQSRLNSALRDILQLDASKRARTKTPNAQDLSTQKRTLLVGPPARRR